jgi:methylthioribose-1-phosphate isomerase
MTWQTLQWIGGPDGWLTCIDQTRLPAERVLCECRSAEAVWEAIRHLRVRGAPAIGIAAAYGVVLGVQSVPDDDPAALAKRLEEVLAYLATSRPTAVNLFWALARMRRVAQSAPRGTPVAALKAALHREARAIHEEDRALCRAIGRHGAALIADGSGVLTHCNAGGLATAEYGTALAILFTCQDQGKRLHVYVDETRPLLQGARLTTWELVQRGIPTTLICDNMAAQVMREGRVQAVVVGADRIAANGDVANKIGTYGLALLAHAHGIPFYVAAPSSSFDLALGCGTQIPIEQRPAEEVTHLAGQRIAPEGVAAYNPAFDVTPARLVTALVTERGIIRPVDREAIAAQLSARESRWAEAAEQAAS